MDWMYALMVFTGIVGVALLLADAFLIWKAIDDDQEWLVIPIVFLLVLGALLVSVSVGINQAHVG